MGFVQLADPNPELVMLESCEAAPVESVTKTVRQRLVSKKAQRSLRM